MNTRIGRSARNFCKKAPSFVLLTKVRLKRDDHSRTSIQTSMDSMLPTMRLVFPASRLTKTPHAGGLSSKNDKLPIVEAKLARLEQGERGSSCEDSPNIEDRTTSLDDEQRGRARMCKV